MKTRQRHKRSTPADVTAALGTLRALRTRLAGAALRELDDIILTLMGEEWAAAQAKHGTHDQSTHGRRRTGVLGDVLDKLSSLREKLSDDDRAELDSAMDQLRGLRSSDVDDWDLDDDDVDEEATDEDDGEGEYDSIVMESASGEVVFTIWGDGDVDVDWGEESYGFRITPQSGREVTDAVAEFSALPVARPPERPDVPDSIETPEQYRAWIEEWHASGAWADYNALVAEMTTSDGKQKVRRWGSGVLEIGDSESIDEDDSQGILQLDDADEAARFVDLLRRALLESAPTKSATRVRVKRNYVRDGDGQFAEVPGGSNPLDKLKLAGRIDLAPGEKLVASQVIPSQMIHWKMPAALIVGPQGTELRLGIVMHEDVPKWTASDRGGTVKLGKPEMFALATKLEELHALGEQRREDLMSVGDGWEDDDDTFATGIVNGQGGWGDIHYAMTGTADGEADWTLDLRRRPPDAPDDWEPDWGYEGDTSITLTPAKTLTMVKVLDRFIDLGVEAESELTKAASRIPHTTRSRDMLTLRAPLKNARPGMAYKGFDAHLKAVDEKGTGTATIVIATLNEVDKDGDVTLPGFFGKQHVQMVPVHDWEHVPIGKGMIYESGNQVLADVKFNLDIPAAKDWHSAIRFDFENPPALQQYSYGYTVLDGGSERGSFKGQSVRFLKGLADGSPGVDAHEVSPVMIGAGTGTRTAAVKAHLRPARPARFTDEAHAVLASVQALSARAADVMAMRQAKGKRFGVDSAGLLTQITEELKALQEVLTEPAASDADVLEQVFLNSLARKYR